MDKPPNRVQVTGTDDGDFLVELLVENSVVHSIRYADEKDAIGYAEAIGELSELLKKIMVDDEMTVIEENGFK